MFSRINFVCMPHEGWMKNGSSFAQKWMKILVHVIGHLHVLPFVKKHLEFWFFLEFDVFWATHIDFRVWGEAPRGFWTWTRLGGSCGQGPGYTLDAWTPIAREPWCPKRRFQGTCARASPSHCAYNEHPSFACLAERSACRSIHKPDR